MNLSSSFVANKFNTFLSFQIISDWYTPPMVKISIEYTGDLHTSAAHSPSGAVLETDAPVDNNGRGASFSPTDLVATALGTCMATVMGIIAQRHKIELKGMKVEVQKIMSDDSPRRIVKLPTTIWIPLPKNFEKRDLLEKAALGCPVFHSVHADIEKPVTFHYLDH
jgi:putative redox protein